MDRADMAYFELTNMGDEALDLSNFEVGRISPWNSMDPPWPEAPQNDAQTIERLPAVILQPGESFVIGSVGDFTEEQYALDVANFGWSYDWGEEFLTKPEMWELIDLQVHFFESPGGPTDSVATSDIPELNFSSLMEVWNGRDVWYVRHHITPNDSAVVDNVGAMFTDDNGTQADGGYVDVAGVDRATGTHYLIRQFDVKQGNTEFVTGIGLDDSEWIPIPTLNPSTDLYSDRLRAAFWTVGNHVNATLDASTLVSSTVTVDYDAKTITVPWGMRNDDTIMNHFDYVPGLAWHYDYVGVHEDSAYTSIRTGDMLTIFACGNTLQTDTFALIVEDALASDNIVIPMKEKNDDGFYGLYGVLYEVTDGVPGMDTISEIPFACRVDSLLKYLEKAPLAEWEIVWVDGVERTDLKDGDLLRVTAEDGTSVKDYYLKLQKFRKGRNADLSSIRWPDIPEIYKGIYGWLGDTIPNFSAQVYGYALELPPGVNVIPGLVGKNADPNASHTVKRAVSLKGSIEDRTISFTSVAENDTTIQEYNIVLSTPPDPLNIQPWAGEPFISQFVWQDQWASSFIEVVNPGTEELDLSHYMFYFGTSDDFAEAITTNSGVDDFDNRYAKYIPGRIWVDTAAWAANPGTCIQDLNVNPIVFPGDVFVIGDIWSTGTAYGGSGYNVNEENPDNVWPAEEQCDINLGAEGKYPCPWDSPPNAWSSLRKWTDGHYYLYKIIGEGGDSVRNGLKPANDPEDFLLLDVFGGEGTETPVVGGETMQQTTGYTRKAHVYQGNTELGGSWGTDATDSEWIKVDRPYFNSIGVGWALDILRICDGLGSHFMDPVTVGLSTVSSYKLAVSDGYTMDEEILGLKDSVTVDEFLAKIAKKHEGQTLTVTSGGVEITGDTWVSHGDSLVVVSSDQSNTSRYFIEVTDDGTLSNDALLTSTELMILMEPIVMVTGFEIGTPLSAVVAAVTVPAGATLSVIDADGAYVPTQTINYDTIPVDVLATSDVFFEVMAENGETFMTYQLIPLGTESDAYVTSTVYDVDQDALLISLVPEGTNLEAFLANLVPATGATLTVLDKLGFERTDGLIVLDDRLVVTSYDGTTSKTYYLSMLEELANFLAYVVSDVYVVDQEEETISGTAVTGDVAVSDFLTNLTPAEGATMEVQDATGTPKLDADLLADDDALQVTSGNGAAYKTYTIVLDHTGIDESASAPLRIYPNPSTGQFYIEGAEIGSKIRVYNAIGVAVREVTALGTETISLEDQPDGLYFITISEDEEVIGHYKVIKQ